VGRTAKQNMQLLPTYDKKFCDSQGGSTVQRFCLCQITLALSGLPKHRRSLQSNSRS